MVLYRLAWKPTHKDSPSKQWLNVIYKDRQFWWSQRTPLQILLHKIGPSGLGEEEQYQRAPFAKFRGKIHHILYKNRQRVTVGDEGIVSMPSDLRYFLSSGKLQLYTSLQSDKQPDKYCRRQEDAHRLELAERRTSTSSKEIQKAKGERNGG